LLLLSGEDSGRKTMLTDTVREALTLGAGAVIDGDEVADVSLMLRVR
jgi:hypothetical protein